ASKIRCDGLSANIVPTSTGKRPACLHKPHPAVVLQCALVSRPAAPAPNTARHGVALPRPRSTKAPGKLLPLHWPTGLACSWARLLRSVPPSPEVETNLNRTLEPPYSSPMSG